MPSFSVLQYKWEAAGAEKLIEILNFSDLSKITDGDIRYAFKKLRQEYTRENKTSFTKKRTSSYFDISSWKRFICREED